MDRVKLNAEEAAWFARNVIKSLTIMDAAATKDPAITQRTTYKTLVKIQEQARAIESAFQAGVTKEFTADVHLVKKHRTVVRTMIDGTIKVLETKIIPTYRDRGDGFEEYLADAVKKTELLKAMSRKFK